MASKAEKETKSTAKKSHTGRNVGIVILLVIIASLAYLYLQYGTIANVALTAATSGQPLNAQTFESAVMQKLSSENVGANYTGSIVVGSDPALRLSFLDDYGTFFYGLYFQNLTGFGSPDIQYIGGGSFNGISGPTMCVNGSPQLANTITNGFYFGGNKCFYVNSQNSFEAFDFLNTFMLFPADSNVSTSAVGLSNYAGTPCYVYSGTANVWINSTIVGSTAGKYIPAALKFNTCFSSQYLLPLTLTANFTAQNGETVNVALNTTGIVLAPNWENITVVG